MTQQFPPKPWNVDDTFVNIETGVEYVFKGEQWIAGGSTQYEAGYTDRGNFDYKRKATDSAPAASKRSSWRECSARRTESSSTKHLKTALLPPKILPSRPAASHC